MKVFVDANLLIYLNTLRDPGKRRIYENFYLEILSRHKAYTDALVLNEVIYISARRYRAPYRVSMEFIDSIVLPFVEILPLGEAEYRRAAEIIEKYQVKPSDALHVAAMALHNVSGIASEDREFDRIDGLTRIWIS